MSEVITPLVRLSDRDTFTPDSDGALVITGAHSHADILRYVISDVGKEHAAQILATLEDKEPMS